MKTIGKIILLMSCFAVFFASCEINPDTEREPAAETILNEYTLALDLNVPGNNGSITYKALGSVPDNMKSIEGKKIIVPSYDGKLIRYLDFEEDGSFPFMSWNTEKDGSGTEYSGGSEIMLFSDVTLYAVYDYMEVSLETEEDDLIDFSVVSVVEMKTGETQILASSIDGYEVYYEIESGDDAVSINGNTVKAETVGDAAVTATAWDDESRHWYCTFSVTAEGFEGSGLEYKLIGTWIYDTDSHLIFNADKSGSITVYLGDTLMQDCTFTWSAFENSYGKYFVISESSGDVNGQFIIERLYGGELRFKGNLGFGLPSETTWEKEECL